MTTEDRAAQVNTERQAEDVARSAAAVAARAVAFNSSVSKEVIALRAALRAATAPAHAGTERAWTVKDSLLTEVGRPVGGGYLRVVVYVDPVASARMTPEALKALQGALANVVINCASALEPGGER